ncbi:MAG: hypothetical protein C0412_08515 [Flavobacterium sp.]|nr:hypothetical protein [Flavobacterium sp.]
MKAKVFFLMAIIGLVLNLKIYPQNLLSPENRLKFGNRLFAERDYLRAINEFTEYLKTTDNDTVRYKIALSYFEMKKFTQAADNYKSLLSSYTLQDDAKFGIIKSNFFTGDFDFIRKSSLSSPYFTAKYENDIHRLINITYLLDSTAQIDQSKFISVFPAEAQPKLLELIKMKTNPEYKDPATAMWLSVLLPGLGKVYVKEYTDGIIAFASTALSVIFAVDSFNAGSNFKGWLFTGLGAFFYGGSIYGSAAAAQIYNAGIRFNFGSELNLFLNKQNFFLPKEKF